MSINKLLTEICLDLTDGTQDLSAFNDQCVLDNLRILDPDQRQEHLEEWLESRPSADHYATWWENYGREMQALILETEPLGVTMTPYFAGHRSRWTGKTDDGLWELEILEGSKKGKKVWRDPTLGIYRERKK